ncbi:MAG: DinB family protein [Saprospiraceae bacterium]|nr:DinB family protein [Saprospiraceae bacterium]
MNLSYFIELADYNIWANKEAILWLENISPEQWAQPVVSSFGSIEATVFHLTGAEKLWRERLVKIQSPSFLSTELRVTKAELLGLWMEASVLLREAVFQFDPEQLNDVFGFRRLNGDYMELAYYQALAHIFNHSTYHRGQLLTLLKQVGYQKITSTDMLFFFKKSHNV